MVMTFKLNHQSISCCLHRLLLTAPECINLCIPSQRRGKWREEKITSVILLLCLLVISSVRYGWITPTYNGARAQ